MTRASVLQRVVMLAAALISSAAASGSVGAQESHLLVIRGLGGTEEMEEDFREWGEQVVTAAGERFGLPEANITYLAPEPASDAGIISGESTGENVETAVQEIASGAGPGDRVLIVLFGHGSWDGEVARISLPGPDLTDQDFATLLDQFDDQTVALVNTASASGGWVSTLSGPRRIIVTATSTPRERNATHFGRFFGEALSRDATDIDMDGTVSLLEAFEYARTEVERHYEERNLLLTEHARLDDDGDGEGTDSPDRREGDGTLAASFRLTPSTSDMAGGDAELEELYQERLRLEEEVRDLEALSGSIDPETYEATLEELLVELAMVNSRIREREGDDGP